MDFLDAVNQANAAATSGSGMEELQRLVADQIDLEQEVADIEAALKERKEHLRKVSEDLIPTTMDRMGWFQMNADKGKAACAIMVNGTTYKVSVAHDLRASIPKDPAGRNAAFTYLRQQGAASIIKREVTAAFGKNEGQQADALVALLRERGDTFTDAEDVHASTLKAWVREKMEAGVDISFEVLGVQPFAKTTIKP